MTENEAIKELETSIELAKMCTQNSERKKEIEAYNMAIKALEEIQQYRAIGTVEELKSLKENGAFTGMELAQLASMQMKLKEYQSIGTIEEFKALKEKNTPKKPFGGMYNWTCPTCGTYHSTHGKCCSECMQMILWD